MNSRTAIDGQGPAISICSADSIDGLESQAQACRRARFPSAPESMNFGDSQNPLTSDRCQQQFWECICDCGREMRLKCRRLMTAYVPAEWRQYLLDGVGSSYEFIDHNFKNWPASMDEMTVKRCFAGVLLVGIITSIVLFLYSIIATVILKLALPFYAELFLVYCLLLRRTELTEQRDGTFLRYLPSQLIDQLWWPPIITELSILLIRYLITGEYFDIATGDCFDLLSRYIVPLAALGAAAVYLGQASPFMLSGPTPRISRFTENNRYACLSTCCLLTYAIRYFSVQGFTLVPLVVRPFLGYIACYLAIRAARKTSADQVTRQCNGTAMSHEIVGSSLSVPTKITNSNKLHLLPEGDFIRLATAADRNSRRVSLPAGSLVPVMAQSNISEARGLIADMLAQKDLPPNLVSGLKAVSGLLLPAIQFNNFLTHFDLPPLLDPPYVGRDGRLASIDSIGRRRQSPIALTWSTTTSATGLPTLEPEPSRPRSSNFWKQKQSAEDQQSQKSRVTPQHSMELNSALIQVPDGTLYSLLEIENDKHLARIKDWSLPIFDIHADSPDTVLTRVAYTIFKRTDLFRIFKISKQKFFSFFHALEEGYWKTPYHNRIHAADVMHATYYFTSNNVPTLGGDSLGAAVTHSRGPTTRGTQEDNDKISEELDNGLKKVSPEGIAENGAVCEEREEGGTNGALASVLSSLELMALYTAAAMHDYDHPGRTNAFLVAIEDKKAILYNDRSVLENHHAAASWQLLCQSENNFIEHLDAAEFKRFRFMVIEAILATDLKRHFDILMDFNTKVSNCGLDWDNESDKLLTCQICIKMADINAPAKPFSLHKEWTNRIVEEFYAQGDDERHLGLPVSPYMDRHDPQLASLQDSFITHIVAPLAQAMNEAGLLPVISSTIDGDSNATARAELLLNLEHNQKYWKTQSCDNEKENQGTSASQSHSSTRKEEENCMCNEMEPIEEQDENGSVHAVSSH